MNGKYIERDFLLQWIDGVETENVRRSFNGLNPKGLNTDGMKHMVLKAPAADVVEVDTVRAWLYEMAMNNTDNYLRYACEEIISRLDGLKEFAKDGRKRG